MKKIQQSPKALLLPLLVSSVLAGCVAEPEPTETDLELDVIIEDQDLEETVSESDTLPQISDPLPQLGMKLFYSKSLGGEFDSACVTCHHPVLGGGDDLSLPVGVEAVNPDLLGQGREHVDGLPLVPRNAPTVFNVGLWDTSLFWDSRVESIGKEEGANGALSGIRTPDSDFGVADADAGTNLAAAQARFPVTSAEEMKTSRFEADSDNAAIRDHLAARIGDYGEGEGELDTNEWLTEFQAAFASAESAEDLITFDNIALAIGEYERSMNFVDTPWSLYVEGDLDAITADQKEGAKLFFTAVNEGGAGCSNCHNGTLFSDGNHHTIAFPQIGPGKGDGATGDDDFGRERETSNPIDRYRFRTPSLLNVAVTAPYGHSGSYQTLEQVVRHYVNPRGAVGAFYQRGGVCQLPQFENIDNCGELYPNSESNTELALAKLANERNQGVSLFASPRLNDQQVQQLVAFLEALTDPCVEDRSCLDAWIPDADTTGPDGQQLNAVNENGGFL
ncbi:MAG: hypothetical protein MI867_14540 [Pseudomonadales bacterium]|nr:hypothetical protein [Pseudomonadales bacterium]